MYSVCHYNSPLGGITLACDEEGLTGLWFDGQKDSEMAGYLFFGARTGFYTATAFDRK